MSEDPANEKIAPLTAAEIAAKCGLHRRGLNGSAWFDDDDRYAVWRCGVTSFAGPGGLYPSQNEALRAYAKSIGVDLDALPDAEPGSTGRALDGPRKKCDGPWMPTVPNDLSGAWECENPAHGARCSFDDPLTLPDAVSPSSSPSSTPVGGDAPASGEGQADGLTDEERALGASLGLEWVGPLDLGVVQFAGSWRVPETGAGRVWREEGQWYAFGTGHHDTMADALRALGARLPAPVPVPDALAHVTAERDAARATVTTALVYLDECGLTGAADLPHRLVDVVKSSRELLAERDVARAALADVGELVGFTGASADVVVAELRRAADAITEAAPDCTALRWYAAVRKVAGQRNDARRDLAAAQAALAEAARLRATERPITERIAERCGLVRGAVHGWISNAANDVLDVWECDGRWLTCEGEPGRTLRERVHARTMPHPTEEAALRAYAAAKGVDLSGLDAPAPTGDQAILDVLATAGILAPSAQIAASVAAGLLMQAGEELAAIDVALGLDGERTHYAGQRVEAVRDLTESRDHWRTRALAAEEREVEQREAEPANPDRAQVAALGEQPAPSGGSGDVWGEILRALDEHHLSDLRPACKARRALGIERYGVPLGYDDLRDDLRDLVEELLDSAAYAWRLGLHRLAVEQLRAASSPSEADRDLLENDAAIEDDVDKAGQLGIVLADAGIGPGPLVERVRELATRATWTPRELRALTGLLATLEESDASMAVALRALCGVEVSRG